MNRLLLFAILMTMGLSACDLEQEVDISLPDYEGRLVVECYLEPGQPFTLLLSRSLPFFAPLPPFDEQFIDNILVDEAQVEIRHGENTYELDNQLFFNPFTRKIFNYSTTDQVPFDTLSPFELMVTLPDGRTITGTTGILPAVPIDSLVVEFSESDTLARVLTYFTDDPGEDNYYRRMFHTSSLDSAAVQDFTIDDRILQGIGLFGTGYDYAEGDTIISSLFHIDRAYYEFQESLSDAISSNGNPFGQPSPIVSNLNGTAGAIGIFTGISYDRKRLILRK